MEEVAGMAILTPVSARLFVVSLLAVTAFPPFGPFFSELRILRVAIETGHGRVAAGFMAGVLFAFFGLMRLAFAILDGRPLAPSRPLRGQLGETLGTLLPPLFLLGCSLWLGLAPPAVLVEAWTSAARALFPLP